MGRLWAILELKILILECYSVIYGSYAHVIIPDISHCREGVTSVSAH